MFSAKKSAEFSLFSDVSLKSRANSLFQTIYPSSFFSIKNLQQLTNKITSLVAVVPAQKTVTV
jgi:hypothetical protein